MKNRFHLISVFIIVISIVISVPVFAEDTLDADEPSFTSGWELDEETSQYRYRLPNGEYAHDWLQIDSDWYWFDDQGYRMSGWVQTDNSWYYLNGEGKRVTDWVKYNGNWFYLNPDTGIMAEGWLKWNNQWYYMKPDTGVMAQGWMKVDGCWYYLTPGTGIMAEGWLKWNGSWYYLCPGSGKMAQSGWYSIGGKQYCFTDGGVWNQNAELWKLTSIINTAAANAGWYVSVMNGSLSSSTVSQLNDDMLALWNSNADVGFLLIDLMTGGVITGNPNTFIYGASVMKGPYACAIGLHAAGSASSYKNQIQPTVSQSDNNAYQFLRRTFGDGILNTYMAEAGVSGVSTSAYYPDVRAKDLAKLWVRNYEYFTSGGSNSSWIKPYFLHSKYSFIDSVMGYKQTVYSKAGWDWEPGLLTVYNDGGIVMKAGAPYVLVVLSHGSKGIHDAKLQKLVKDLDAAHSEMTGSGWILEGESWYYKGASGKMLTGWQFIGGVWYYFIDSGEMATGWVLSKGTWYYMNSNGVMQTGWVQADGDWYYLNSGGKMLTGWQKLGGYWYFLKPNGKMASGEWYNGYWFNKNGTWTYKPKGQWKKNSIGWWFGDTSGWYAKDETIVINDIEYSFDENGYWIE